MDFRRIKAMLWQELFITYRSGEVIADVFVMPFGSFLVFGFLSLYLSGHDPSLGKLVIIGMLLWQVIWVVQYSVTLGSLWNVWSRNLTNIFITPIRVGEYILAHTLSGVAKAALMLTLSAALSVHAFNFNLLDIGLVPLVLAFVNFTLFAYAVGVVLLGLIFRYGTRVQALAWGTITFLQPLVAAFYPLEIMPSALQFIAKTFPATYTFEAARFALFNSGAIDWNLFGAAFALNAVYVIACTALFVHFYNSSRDTGQFARNET